MTVLYWYEGAEGSRRIRAEEEWAERGAGGRGVAGDGGREAQGRGEGAVVDPGFWKGGFVLFGARRAAKNFPWTRPLLVKLRPLNLQSISSAELARKVLN